MQMWSDTETHKECRTCREVKLHAEYQPFVKDGKPRLYSYCRACSGVRQKNMRAKKTPEQLKEVAQRQHVAHLKRTFGLLKEDHTALWDRQGAKCAICSGALRRGGGGCATDHCHATGKVRALLCSPCNLGLGSYQDDPARLRAAADYIEMHRSAHLGSHTGTPNAEAH